MNRAYFRSAGACALGAALVAVMLMAAAATGRAQGGEGREYRRGDRPDAPSRERVQPAPSSGGEKWRRSEGGRREGGRDAGGYGSAPGGGDKWRRGELEHRGGGRGWNDGGWRGHGGDRGWYGGGRHYSPPRRYWRRPHSSFRVQIGLPYYYPYWSYRRHYVIRRPVVREYVPQIEVENDPPAGCYYWDPYCDRGWDTLDEYTEHLDGADHGNTVEIVDESSGEWVRTLVFVEGYWSVRR
ncbi:MAG: hypothetical protein U0704_14500 [Candidatus Eisenbacteria bacterium]